jgi:hypothetical protein
MGMHEVEIDNIVFFLSVAVSGNLSRQGLVYQSATYNNRNGSLANDGNYDNANPSMCATAMSNTSAYSYAIPSYMKYNLILDNIYLNVQSTTWWLIDLRDVYAVLHVIMYNAAFLPGNVASNECILNSATQFTHVLPLTPLWWSY